MGSVNSLHNRMNKVLVAVEAAQENAELPGMSERILAAAQEKLSRKIALVRNNGGTPEDFEAQCKLIDEDVESRKTPAERRAEKRFAAKNRPDPDIRVRMLEKIEQYRMTSQDGRAS